MRILLQAGSLYAPKVVYWNETTKVTLINLFLYFSM